MRHLILTSLIFNSLIGIISAENGEYPTDLVEHLPGLNFTLNFKQFSGYLHASNDVYLHYWLFESQHDPINDPLVFWFNGGPGSSSLLGALTENGPFRIDSNENVKLNNFSWNSKANMVYIESPAGVGFSYKLDKNYTTNDNITADNNYFAIENFFEKFPKFRNHDLYITGESYGGIYIPTLSVKLLQNDKFRKNFKGFAVGNGAHHFEFLYNSRVHFLYHHTIIEDLKWEKLMRVCCPNNDKHDENCNFYKSSNPMCKKEIKNISVSIRRNFDPYNLYHWMCFDPINDQSMTENIVADDFMAILRASSRQLLIGTNSRSFNAKFAAPTVDYQALKRYMNRHETQKALNINSNSKSLWNYNSDDINYTNLYQDMSKHVRLLINSGIKGLIYNGDFDTVCNYLGNKWFVENLGFKASSEYLPWKYNNQIAGFEKRYANNKLIYKTIMGSGHMVPMDQPGPSQALFYEFLQL